MYDRSQIEKLLDLITDLNNSASSAGCEQGLGLIDSNLLDNLVLEARRIKNLKQVLTIGHHQHRHGESLHFFLVPEGVPFGLKEFEKVLMDEFEPERGEDLEIFTESVDVLDAVRLQKAPYQFLEDLGYSVIEDPAGPGKWFWTAPSDQSSTAFDSEAEALEAAFADASEQTRSIIGMSDEDWAGLSFSKQCDMIAESLSPGDEDQLNENAGSPQPA